MFTLSRLLLGLIRVLFYFVLDDKFLKIRNMSFRGSISRAFENTVCTYVPNESQATTRIIVSFIRGPCFLLSGRKFCQILWSFLKTYFPSEYLLKLDPNGSNFSVLQLKISFLCDIYRMWCVNKGKWVNRNFEGKKKGILYHFLLFNWRRIAVECFVGFCCTTVWLSYQYTHTPSLLSLSPPTPSHPLGHHRAPSWAPCTDSHWLSVLHMVVYIFCCCLVTKLCLGLQGDPASPFWRRSALGVFWREWC